MADGPSRGKKMKRQDKRPARTRYWLKRQLERNKVKALMKRGIDKERARRLWVYGDKEGNCRRQGRVPNGFFSLRQSVEGE